MAAAAETKYEEFDPTTETVHERDCDTIRVYVPGFKKGQLRVQLIVSTNLLRVSGEKEMEAGKSIRFRKEFPVRPNIDADQISAKFEKGILHVKLPKLADHEQKQSTKTTPTSDQAINRPDNIDNHTRNVNEKNDTAATMTLSDICSKLSRRAFYALLMGLAAVGVGLYLKSRA